MKLSYLIIFILLLQSCLTGKLEPSNKNFTLKKILSENTKSYIYRADFRLYDNNFSGLLILKNQNKSRRIVFINEIGMKFFDLELFADSFKIHHIFGPMNKKMFINLLVDDFNFMLMNNIDSNSENFIDKKTGNLVLKQKNVKEIYYFDKNTLLPKSAEKYSLIRKIVFIKYKNYRNKIPKHINIKHKNIKFEMNLTFIK